MYALGGGGGKHRRGLQETNVVQLGEQWRRQEGAVIAAELQVPPAPSNQTDCVLSSALHKCML